MLTVFISIGAPAAADRRWRSNACCLGSACVSMGLAWFAPSARMQKAFDTVLTGVTVRTSIRLEHCYRKHGTDIAVRLYVIDKAAGGADAGRSPAVTKALLLALALLPARAADLARWYDLDLRDDPGGQVPGRAEAGRRGDPGLLRRAPVSA